MTNENNAGVEVDPQAGTISHSEYEHYDLGWCSKCSSMYCSHDKKHFADIYKVIQ